jgi:hypothetical protein
LDRHGVTRLGLSVRRDEYEVARLARRGNTFFVLEPGVSYRTVDKGEQCYCDGGYSGHYDPNYVGFVIDDMAGYELRTLEVPMVKEVIEWTCKARLVEAEKSQIRNGSTDRANTSVEVTDTHQVF